MRSVCSSMSLPPPLLSTPPKRRTPRVLACALAGLLLVATLGELAHRLYRPRWYFAELTLRNLRPAWTTRGISPAFTGEPMSHAQRVCGTEILYPVIDMLRLTQGYVREGTSTNKQETFNRLAASLQIEAFAGDPQVMRIGVYDRDPQRAASIANTIAIVYLRRRAEDESGQYERVLSSYAEEVELQRARVQLRAEEMQRIGAHDQVADPDPERADAAVTGQLTSGYSTAKAQYLQARRKLENTETALSEARSEKAFIEEPPVRIQTRAVPPLRPVAWWRGDPRTWSGFVLR